MGFEDSGPSRKSIGRIACDISGESTPDKASGSLDGGVERQDEEEFALESFSKTIEKYSGKPNGRAKSKSIYGCVGNGGIRYSEPDPAETRISRPKAKPPSVLTTSGDSVSATPRSKSSSSYSSRKSTSSSSAPNAYKRMADELAGKKSQVKSQGGCGWHSGINSNISTDKRKSIDKRINWMETAFRDKKTPQSEKERLSTSIGKRFDNLDMFTVPPEARTEIRKLQSEFDQLKRLL